MLNACCLAPEKMMKPHVRLLVREDLRVIGMIVTVVTNPAMLHLSRLSVCPTAIPLPRDCY